MICSSSTTSVVWATRLLLPDGRAVHRVAARGDIVDADGDDVTAAKLAVDRQVKEGEIPLLSLDPQLRPDRPDMARTLWRFGVDELAFVPGRAAWLLSGRCIIFHGLSPWLRDGPACSSHTEMIDGMAGIRKHLPCDVTTRRDLPIYAVQNRHITL